MQFILILEAVILASSLSLDALTAGFAYGSNKIKIPFSSVQIINFICSGFTGIALLVGAVLKNYIPSTVTIGICFTILFILGIIKLLDSITKSIIRKYSNLKKELKFSLFNFKFILKLYANPEDADVDNSKTISAAEAASIAIALSLDGIAVGFGAALGNVNGLYVFLFSLITNSLAIIAGHRLGEKIATKISFNLSWLSGVILIVLAFSKLV